MAANKWKLIGNEKLIVILKTFALKGGTSESCMVWYYYRNVDNCYHLRKEVFDSK